MTSIQHFQFVTSIEEIAIVRDIIVQAVIFDRPSMVFNDPSKEASDITRIRKLYPTSFLVVYEPHAAYRPFYRLTCFDLGVNMVAHDIDSLVSTLSRAVILSNHERGARRYTCPYCHLSGLTEFEMWNHIPVYHVNWPAHSRVQDTCPICNHYYKRPLQVHIHARHGPSAYDRIGQRSESKASITQLYCFSLVVCRHPVTGLFLLCQEFANQGFWLPGGAVDNNESITKAAKRETMEEAGLEIDLKGILSIEYNPCGLYESEPSLEKYLVRMRVIFYAEPTIDQMNRLPKSSPDFESVGACWCSMEEILMQEPKSLKLRGSEPRQWVTYLQKGGTIYPLDILKEKEG